MTVKELKEKMQDLDDDVEVHHAGTFDYDDEDKIMYM